MEVGIKQRRRKSLNVYVVTTTGFGHISINHVRARSCAEALRKERDRHGIKQEVKVSSRGY